jgi:hypothetical protein
MPTEFPFLIVGFNAFGLCFDDLLGRKLTVKPGENPDAKLNFFRYLKKHQYPFNWVKIVCFYKETVDVPDTDQRLIKLYENGEISDKFKKNLVELVDEANACDFKVQVCLFSRQAVAEPVKYAPDPLPQVYTDVLKLTDLDDRLRTFFSPAPSDLLTKQKDLVSTIAGAVKGKTNVFWELCNEAHLDKSNSPEDEANLIKWLIEIEDTLHTVNKGAKICTSTGVKNQNETPVATKVPVSFYDFHLLQWNKSDGKDYIRLLNAAKKRADGYRPVGAPLIINDDGGVDAAPDTAPANKWRERTAANIKKWAAAAFDRRLGYMSKLPYPTGLPWDTKLLGAIKEAYEMPRRSHPDEADSDDSDLD